MKQAIFVATVASLLLASSAFGQATRYWDINGVTDGAGGATPSGTWDNTITNWNATAAGTGAATTWSPSGNARFAAGTDATGSYTVTVNGTVNVNQIGMEQGTVTFSGGTLNFTRDAAAAAANSSLLTGIAGGTPDVTANINSLMTGTTGFRMARSTVVGTHIAVVGNTSNTLSGGIFINSGQTIRLGASGVIDDSNVISFNTAAAASTLDLNGFSETVAALRQESGTTAPNVTLGSGTLTLANPSGQNFIGVISGSGNVVKNGSGTQIFSGANTYIGTTSIGAGTLQIGNAGTTGSLSNSTTVNNNGNLQFNRTDGYTFNGTIGGTGTVTQNGTGTLTLGGANSYGGGTTINGGTLKVANTTGSATGSGAVTVNNGGTLAGAGAVTGPVVVNSGGKVAPGTSPGVLNVGSITFNTGSTFQYEVDSNAAPAAAADLINANGNLTIAASGALLNVTYAGTTLLSKLTLVSYAGTWDGNVFDGFADDSVVMLGTNEYTINYDDITGGVNFGGGIYGDGLNPHFVTLTAVPEASVVLFGSLVGVGLCLAGLRRKVGKTSATPAAAFTAVEDMQAAQN